MAPPRIHPDKQGHVCFGSCCCDMRRAVIVVNAAVLLPLTVVSILASAGSTTDEEESDGWNAVGIAFVTANIVFSLLAILGAVQYQLWMVLPNAVYICGGWISYIVAFVQGFPYATNDGGSNSSNSNDEIRLGDAVVFLIVSTITSWCFLYPHIVFMKEVQQKIMTPENYATREKYSCCCIVEDAQQEEERLRREQHQQRFDDDQNTIEMNSFDDDDDDDGETHRDEEDV